MASKNPSTITKPVISPKKPRELVEMSSLLRKFEDHVIHDIMELPEGPERAGKEKRLGLARGARAALEWALGIEGKEIDQTVIGAEWAEWRRQHEQ